MKIEQVDAFYLRLPDVRDIGDGSQDALLIRVRAGGFEGWGECEASPLPTIAALVAPMSHSACKPVLTTVLGAEIDGPESIANLHRRVKENSLDLLQTDHALSGIDIALWDLLGKREQAPVWSFFGPSGGRNSNGARLAYASSLFGDDPAETLLKAKTIATQGYRAAKFGWGPFGHGYLADDIAQIEAAREGLGPDIDLLVDAGCAFGHDVSRAAERLPALEHNKVGWLEEPFATGALRQYSELADRSTIPMAGGEGCHFADQARHYVDYAKVGFVQVDTGRIGGITAAREVALYARERGVRYVNHTFTSNLALSASLQPFADSPDGQYAEVPVAPSELAAAIGGPTWPLDDNGCVRAPNSPGLGVEIDLQKIEPYRQEIEIKFQGRTIWPLTS